MPPDIAAKRIGNPPRRASLPMCQISAINTPIGPSSADSASQSTRQSSATPDTHVPRPKSALVTQDVRPTSPKLHHIHGLPNSKAYPFIYKREVSRHLTALHAGSPSPLADFAHAAQARTSVDVATDYSETVYYGSRILPAFSPTPDQRLSPQRSLSNVVVEQTANSSEQDLTPRLRGGGEEERAHNPSCGLTLKQLLLTCHKAGRRHTTNPNSDETITPTRIPDAVQIAQAIRKTQGTARLPRNLLKKNSPQATQRTTQLELPREDAPTILPTHKTHVQTSRVRRHTRSLHTPPFPLQYLCYPRLHPPASPTNTPFLLQHQHQNRPLIPTLRGGASSLSSLSDHNTLPSNLFWLAGGRGAPITAGSWKRQKPKKRMGGLLGKLVYGTRAGTVYGSKKDADVDDVASRPGSVTGTIVPVPAVGAEGGDGGEGNVSSSRCSSSAKGGSEKGCGSRTPAKEGARSKSSASVVESVAGSKKEAEAEVVLDKNEDAAKEDAAKDADGA